MSTETPKAVLAAILSQGYTEIHGLRIYRPKVTHGWAFALAGLSLAEISEWTPRDFFKAIAILSQEAGTACEYVRAMTDVTLEEFAARIDLDHAQDCINALGNVFKTFGDVLGAPESGSDPTKGTGG